jgi:hypothetical protein
MTFQTSRVPVVYRTCTARVLPVYRLCTGELELSNR